MNYLEGISSIIFDLGGVIIDLDIEKTKAELCKVLGFSQPNLYYSNEYAPLFSEFEVGKISEKGFIDGLIQKSLNESSPDQIINAWNSMLVEIPQERIKMLEILKKKYRLFILSNTNSIHVERFEKMATGYHSLAELFENAYYSHIIGFRKPNVEAFKAVIDGSKLNPHTTLFVDDLQANIDAANTLGFKTLHITGKSDVSKILTANSNF